MTAQHPSRDELYRLYHEEQKSTAEVARILGVTKSAVRYLLQREGISIRSRAEGTKLSHERSERKPRPIAIKLKSELLCRKCGASWSYSGSSVITQCPYCGATKDARDRTGAGASHKNAVQRKKSMIAWSEQPENRRARGTKYRILTRKRVFFKVSGSISPVCVRCGCDDTRLLEINHKNGGGAKEMQNGKGSTRFYLDIANGTRDTDDLELLCKPCNAIHALELKYGQLPMRVVWSGQQTDSTP
jgi:hypothetical protein